MSFWRISGSVGAATPSTQLNFQARLSSATGQVVPDGNYHIEFKIYNASSSSGSSQGSCTGDAACEWTETRTTGNLVRVVNGYLTVNLGSVNALPGTINWDQEQYLTMNIGGSGGSAVWDGEMNPRLKLTAMPYAFQAGQLAKTSGANRGTLSFGTIATNPAITLPDASGTVCLQSASACGFATGSGTAFLQGGNSFGTAANLGTNDSNVLNLRTNGSTKLTVDTTGNLTFNQSSTIGLSSAGTANTLTIQGGTATTGNNNGGNVTIQGGTPAGSGAYGNLILQQSGGNVAIGKLQIPSGVTATATTVTSGTMSGTYYYKVTAVDAAGGETPASSEVSATVSGANNAVALSWTAVSGAKGYNLYRGTVSGGETAGYFFSSTNAINDTLRTLTCACAPPVTNNSTQSLLGPSGETWLGTSSLNVSGVSDETLLQLTAVAGTANDIVRIKTNDAARAVLTVTNQGSLQLEPSVDNGNVLQVKGAQSNATLFNIDTRADSLNLVTAGGFEGNIMTGWSALGSAGLSTNNIQYLGNNGLLVTTTAAAGDGGKYTFSGGALANGTYTFSLYAKTPNAVGNVSTLVMGYSANGTPAGEVDCTPGLTGQTVVTGGYTRFSCPVTVSGATAANYIYIKQTDAVARSFNIDGVQVANSSTPLPYHEGLLSNSTGLFNQPAVFQNGFDSTTALQVVNKANAVVLNVDTTNQRVGIGTSSPSAPLSVGSSSQFQVSSAGAVTAVGVNAGTGLLQGSGGLTVTGAAVSLNASSNFATNINTGTSTGAVTIGNNAAGTISLQSGSGINIGNNAVAQTLNIGNTTGATALNLYAGTGNFTLDGVAGTTYTLGASTIGGTITIGGTAQTGAINIATGTGAQAVNLGTGGTGAKTVVVGSTASTGTTTLQAGTGGINIGTGGIANIIQIGNTTGAVAQTINIGNNATASSATTLLMGSTIGTSTTTLQSGSGGIVIPASLAGTVNTSTYLCRNSSNQLTTCATTGTGAAFLQGGNSFGAAADLGTNDANVLNLRTNGTTRLTVDTGGNLTFNQSSTIGLSSAGTANTLTIQGGTATTGNNNGGNITLQGGTPAGSGAYGNLILQQSGGNVLLGNPSLSSGRLEVAGAANLWAGEFAGSGTTGQSFGLRVVAGTNSSDTAFGVSNASLSTSYFTVRGDGSVGIGTSTPGATFDSRGSAQFRSVTDSVTSFMVQNAAGAAALSVDTTGSSSNLAVNGGAESTFGTEWAAQGAATVSRDTTANEFASGTASAKAVTTAANQGIKNNLGAALSNTGSQVYNVSFSIKTVGTTVANGNLSVTYLRDGSTTDATCSSFTSSTNPVINSTSFIKYTCTLTPSSTAGTTAAAIAITQTDATGRTILIDNLNVTAQNSSGTQNTNVLRVGGANSQGLTLLTLDTYAGTPFTGTNTSLVGSMYFDTTSGKIQCYDGSNWGACGAAPNNIITLSPEFNNAVLHGSGIGTLISDFCSASLNINDGTSGQPTICAASQTFNYYKWTSPQATAQTYSIYVTYQLPSTFKGFVSGQTSLTGRTDSTNSTVQYTIYRNSSGTLTQCGSTVAVSTGVQSSWQTGTASGTADPSNCSGNAFTAGNSIVFKIDVIASSSANAYVSNLNFQFSNK